MRLSMIDALRNDVNAIWKAWEKELERRGQAKQGRLL